MGKGPKMTDEIKASIKKMRIDASANGQDRAIQRGDSIRVIEKHKELDLYMLACDYESLTEEVVHLREQIGIVQELAERYKSELDEAKRLGKTAKEYYIKAEQRKCCGNCTHYSEEPCYVGCISNICLITQKDIKVIDCCVNWGAR